MSWISEKATADLGRVRDAQQKQIYPYFRPFESGGLHTTIDGKPIVNFSSNDYHPLPGNGFWTFLCHDDSWRFDDGADASRGSYPI